MGVPSMLSGVPLRSGSVPKCGCCDPFCDGCTETTPISSLTLSVDASLAVLEPAWSHDCSDETCQSLSGTYTLSSYTPGDTTPDLLLCGEDTSAEPEPCFWEFCPTGTSGDLDPGCGSYTAWVYWRVTIGQFGGDWWISVTLNLQTYIGIGAPSGACNFDNTDCGIYTWNKNLGASRPECSTLFPLTLNNTDIFCDTIDEQNCCIFDDIELTIDLP